MRKFVENNTKQIGVCQRKQLIILIEMQQKLLDWKM